MCSKSRPPPASRAVALRLVVTFTAAAATASTALMVASPSSLPILLGVDAFSPSSRVSSTNQRLLRSFGSFPTAASTSQRINTVRLHAADGNDDEEYDDKSANESSSDGDEPAPSATAGAEDEVSRQLAKAKELIERTKQKMEKKEKAAATAVSKDDGEAEETTGTVSDDDDDEVLPFFAVDPTAAEKRRELVTKTKDEESGLITTDGEKMASLAEGEKWESRGLYDLFENEREEDEENLVKEARASRDVARNMMGLKRIMNKEDFDAIFDKRNLFIGEE